MQMAPEHVRQVAQLEQLCFPDPWPESAIAGELTNPLSLWLVAMRENPGVRLHRQSVRDGRGGRDESGGASGLPKVPDWERSWFWG